MVCPLQVTERKNLTKSAFNTQEKYFSEVEINFTINYMGDGWWGAGSLSHGVRALITKARG